ncbi:hypothetical protein HRR81_000282 [Exophiala dermatitidis]|nr:hypothetical protein HRR81_000282 [Exophiala dermatitidis]
MLFLSYIQVFQKQRHKLCIQASTRPTRRRALDGAKTWGKVPREDGAAASAAATIPLAANGEPAPTYRPESNRPATLPPAQPRRPSENAAKAGVARSARYPRVAVVLGVRPRWHLPLLLCRALSLISAIWWACQTCYSIYQLVYKRASSTEQRLEVGDNGLLQSPSFKRIVIAQIALSFLWAGAAAYLAHMFASSLMARWLLHYSPFAVLVRLCSLSILLSFACMQVFHFTAATEPDVLKLSRSLLVWIVLSITLMLVYFCTQQDISLETDRDDRRRRQILRLKCLYVISACSLFSLTVLLCLLHFDSMSWDWADMEQLRYSVVSRWRQLSTTVRGEL